MARDALRSHQSGVSQKLAIDVRDEDGPVFQAMIVYAVSRPA